MHKARVARGHEESQGPPGKTETSTWSACLAKDEVLREEEEEQGVLLKPVEGLVADTETCCSKWEDEGELSYTHHGPARQSCL